MKYIRTSCLLGFIMILMAPGIFAQQSPTPRSYVAYKTDEPIGVDGIDNERAWSEVPWTADFIDIEGVKTPKYRTRVKMMWDDTYLYFFGKLEEPQVWGSLKQRDTVVFYNNDFEIFIDPDGDTHNYYEFEMNALNTVWDLFLVKPYRESAPVIDSWDIQGLKSAVHISGTLNDPSDIDKGWSVEVAMPWKVLTEAAPGNKVPADDFWRLNFSRVNWDFQVENGHYSRKKDGNGDFLPEYNWVWSPQGVINMHEPEHWGYVYFSSKQPGEKDEFIIPRDEQLRWLLYDLYRKQKAYYRVHHKWAENLSQIVDGPLLMDGETLDPKLETHRAGWNIILISPFTGKLFLIKEDGKILKYPKSDKK